MQDPICLLLLHCPAYSSYIHSNTYLLKQLSEIPSTAPYLPQASFSYLIHIHRASLSCSPLIQWRTTFMAVSQHRFPNLFTFRKPLFKAFYLSSISTRCSCPDCSTIPWSITPPCAFPSTLATPRGQFLGIQRAMMTFSKTLI